MNDSVIVTFELLLMTDDRETLTADASLSKIAGNETPARVSTGPPFASNDDMTRSLLAPATYGGRISPLIVQTTAELEDAKPEPLMKTFKNGLL
jgi:hypothetical protein